MYKKITHNIVEEHFDHPMASQIQKSLFKASRPTTEILDENKFRTDVKEFFQNYINKNNIIIESVTGSEDDLIDAVESLFNTGVVDKLGNMTKPIYFTEFGERINYAMRGLPIVLTMMIHARKIGQSDQNFTTRFNMWATDLAMALTQFNSGIQFQPTLDLWTTYLTELRNKLEAKVKKDTAAEQTANEQINSKIDLFSDYFSNLVVSQHPTRFVKA